MRNKVNLVTYADRLGGDLDGLRILLDGPFDGLFGGVHILPFFIPFDGADAGFDADDHTSVDPRLGTWDDIAAIATDNDVMADLIVNHVSRNSPQFLDWEEKGGASPYAGMFLTADRVFPGGIDSPDAALVFRPRPGRPFTKYEINGTATDVWTTFTSEQVDIDVGDEATQTYIGQILDNMVSAGVSSIRLDAVGYAVKTPGTSCFMTPETYNFIDELAAWCRDRGLEVLVEIHSHFEQQIAIAKRVDKVYDFALPPLVLHGLTTGDPTALARWLEVRPHNTVTVLDTHDGIGVVDVGASGERPGLLSNQQIDDLVEQIHALSGGASLLATGKAASNVDLYQVNSTYYDALGGDDDAYLLARAIQFFTPGIPQVYYVGLLAGRNDTNLLQRTGVGRDVNRHHFTRTEIDEELERPVVKALLSMIRFRNACRAFDGSFSHTETDRGLEMRWEHEGTVAVLAADFIHRSGQVSVTEPGSATAVFSLWDLPG